LKIVSPFLYSEGMDNSSPFLPKDSATSLILITSLFESKPSLYQSKNLVFEFGALYVTDLNAASYPCFLHKLLMDVEKDEISCVERLLLL
jgi:hypothetical protein